MNLLVVRRSHFHSIIFFYLCVFNPGGFQPQVLDAFSFDRAVLFENSDNGRDLQFPNSLLCNGTENRLADCLMEPLTDMRVACNTFGLGIRCPTEGE